MTRFEGHYDQTHTVSAPPEVVLAQFLDLDQIIEHFGDLDSADRVDENTLTFHLKEQNHGVFTFKGLYTCRYLADGDVGVKWASEGEGNVETKGHLTVAPGDAAGTTRLHYVADMALEIDVNKMLAPMLKPVVEAIIPHQMGDYVKRMIKGAESR